MLDEKRINPTLQDQVETLKNYAKEKSCIIIFIAQLQRDVESRVDKKPTIDDIRLPNPLDLKLFNKLLLLFKSEEKSEKVEVNFYRPKEFSFVVNWDNSLKFS
jgi:replicative DNA helicase